MALVPAASSCGYLLVVLGRCLAVDHARIEKIVPSEENNQIFKKELYHIIAKTMLTRIK